MDAAPTECMQSKTSRRMKVFEEPVPRSATKPKGASKNASSAVNRDYGCKRGVIGGNSAPDEAGTVFRQCEGGVDTRRDSQNLGAVNSRRVRKIGRKLQGRTWARAGHGQRAGRRWCNIMNSASRGAGVQKLMGGGGACQPGLTCMIELQR